MPLMSLTLTPFLQNVIFTILFFLYHLLLKRFYTDIVIVIYLLNAQFTVMVPALPLFLLDDLRFNCNQMVTELMN